jgi:hypothetical protein
MWLKPLFAHTLKNVKSGFRKWLEDLPQAAGADIIKIETQRAKQGVPKVFAGV